jgi:carboxyl-terminal processing protease
MRGFLRVRWPMVALLAVALIGAACESESVDVGGGSTSTTVSLTTTTLSPTTTVAEAIDWRVYVEEALAWLEELYYQAERVDWDEVRETAWEVLGGNPTQESAHRAIEMAIQEMSAPHTFFLNPEAVQQREAGMLALPPPTGGVAADRIGLLHLPGTGRGEMGKYYATSLHDLARAASAAGVCGWVIDLRDNVGGSMVPMLLGLGPFLGDGVFLTTRRPATGSESSYLYEEGQLLVNGAPSDVPLEVPELRIPADILEEQLAAARLYTEPFVLPDPFQPIAILTSFSTASAGEAVVIAFKGRSGTRFFGEPTYGLPTGNTGLSLEDGALLVITSAVLVDRNGRVYEGSINPDEIVVPLPQTDTDEVLDRATQWILAQPACST